MSDFDRKLRKKPMSSYSIAEPVGIRGLAADT